MLELELSTLWSATVEYEMGLVANPMEFGIVEPGAGFYSCVHAPAAQPAVDPTMEIEEPGPGFYSAGGVEFGFYSGEAGVAVAGAPAEDDWEVSGSTEL